MEGMLFNNLNANVLLFLKFQHIHNIIAFIVQ